MPRWAIPLLDRLMAKRRIDPVKGCWIFTGAKSNGHGKWARNSGYGYIYEGPETGKIILVHRASFQIFKGPIPDGHTIDHSCVCRLCWNPDHLFDVTLQRNNELKRERARAPKALPDADIPF
jgi:hypothetical protein